MKLVSVAIVSVAVLILFRIPALKQHKGKIIAGYACALILLSVAIDVKTLNLMLPFYTPTDQVFYQPEFLEEGIYPDAIIPYIVEGKTVYTKNDPVNSRQEAMDMGYDWVYAYFHMHNIVDYLKTVGASVVSKEDYNDILINDKQKECFTDFGYTNDMFRYMFNLNDIKEEWGNSFYFFWYYCNHAGESRVYICTEGIKDCDEIMLIWQGEEAEDIYIISKDYYEKEVAGL